MVALLFRPTADNPTARTVNSADSGSVMFHEYTHGLSSRLIVDAQGVDALTFAQPRSLGEAWSDWYAHDYLVASALTDDTAAAGEVAWDPYGGPGGRTEGIDCPVGASASACPGDPEGSAGTGGYTYGDMGKVIGYPEPHADGEIWSQTLWDLRARLMADHGTADGENRARLLATAGIELSPPEPSFLDARNAILEADATYNGGDDHDAIWSVFAARGMGYFAATTDETDTRPVQDFSTPPTGPEGGLSGVVRTTGGSPVAGARVTVGGFLGYFEATTGSSGAYAMGPLPPGTYREVVVSPRNGFDGAVAPDVTVPSGGTGQRNFTVERNWAAASGGGSIAGSSPSNGCYPAGAAIDGSFGTGWGARAPTSALLPGSKALTIRLPQPVDISRIAIDPTFACGGYTASLGHFALEVSTDGQSFRSVANRTFTRADDWRRNQLAVPAGTALNARYVRVTALSSQDSSGGHYGAVYVGLTELQVYGVPGDVIPPDTVIRSAPARLDRDRTPTFAFESSEGGAAFQCVLDDGPVKACSSPTDLSVGDGRHVFSVRAVDRHGNADPTPASRRFVVDTGLRFKLGRKRTQRLGPARRVIVAAICPAETCSVVGRGSVTLTQPGPGSGRVGLHSVHRRLSKGTRRRLSLRLSARGARRVRAAIHHGGKATARVSIVAADAAGNKRRRSVRIRVVL
jgi:hypothetical protein